MIHRFTQILSRQTFIFIFLPCSKITSMNKLLFCLSILLIQSASAQEKKYYTINADSTEFKLTNDGANLLASLPLKCLEQEYPNKTGHTSISDSDQVLTPKQLHPVFYGCFDWHSCVHGYWMLARLMKLFPQLPVAAQVKNIFNKNITVENVALEMKYLDGKLSKTFERTYGWAWLLKLQQELNDWNDAGAINWKNKLQPLVDKVIKLWRQFLPKQTYPSRTGVHPNTAFGLVFALDYARATGNNIFEGEIIESAKQLFLNDKDAPANWEPDGADFLSPSLEEADLMRRVLPKNDFIKWFNRFYNNSTLQHITQLPVVSDRNDYQIVHLDGLAFSRSWCMKGIASMLPSTDKRKKLLFNAAARHLATSLPNIVTGNYGGEHWLASFAVYALAN